MIALRASSLADFFDCAARAEAKHLLGLRTPTSVKALLGTAVHASTAVYDRSTIERAGITIDEAAAAAVDVLHRPDEEVILDESPNDIERIALALHRKYCAEVAPTQDYAAVEVTCDELVISDLAISLTGTTDRVYKSGDGYGIADLKTGKTAVNADGVCKTAGHAYQVGVYELLAQHGSGLPITEPGKIIGMQTGKTKKAQRMAIGEISGARDVLLGDEDFPGVLEMVANMVHAGVFPGNPRSMLCSEQYCPIHHRCKFRR